MLIQCSRSQGFSFWDHFLRQSQVTKALSSPTKAPTLQASLDSMETAPEATDEVTWFEVSYGTPRLQQEMPCSK